MASDALAGPGSHARRVLLTSSRTHVGQLTTQARPPHTGRTQAAHRPPDQDRPGGRPTYSSYKEGHYAHFMLASISSVRKPVAGLGI